MLQPRPWVLFLQLLLAAVATRRCVSEALTLRYMESSPTESLALDGTGMIAYLSYKGDSPVSGALYVTRCDLRDGTCGDHYVGNMVTPALSVNHGFSPSARVDTTSAKLLIATGNRGFSGPWAVSLFRCGLDMNACSHFDLSALASRVGNGDFYPHLLLNDKAGEVFVSSRTSGLSQVSLYRCNLDVSSCVHFNVSELATPVIGENKASSHGMSAAIAPVVERLYVAAVTEVLPSDYQVTLYSCTLDMSGCSHHNVQGSAAYSPSAVVDESNGYVLVAGDGTAANSGLSLFRCTLDVSSCVYFQIGNLFSPSYGTTSAREPYAVVVPMVQRLFVFTRNQPGLHTLSLFTCTLGEIDSCDHYNLSSLASATQGSGSSTASDPSAAVSAASGKVVVGTRNHGLFEVLYDRETKVEVNC